MISIQNESDEDDSHEDNDCDSQIQSILENHYKCVSNDAITKGKTKNIY